MSDLTLICGPCGFPVAGDTGCLRVSHAEVLRSRRAMRDWRRRHPAGAVIDAVELLGMPGAVEWVVWHDKCRPAESDDGYEIDAERLRTWAHLAHWTAHLMSKTWLSATDWDDVLREAAGDVPARRIRVARSVAA